MFKSELCVILPLRLMAKHAVTHIEKNPNGTIGFTVHENMVYGTKIIYYHSYRTVHDLKLLANAGAQSRNKNLTSMLDFLPKAWFY